MLQKFEVNHQQWNSYLQLLPFCHWQTVHWWNYYYYDVGPSCSLPVCSLHWWDNGNPDIGILPGLPTKCSSL